MAGFSKAEHEQLGIPESPDAALHVERNRRRQPKLPAGDFMHGAAAARAAIRRWPTYAPTPLLRLDGLARRLGIGRLWVKDEGSRKPLTSFKVLGGAYAVGEALCDVIAQGTGSRPDAAALLAGSHRDRTKTLTATCASDGNHGRAVAFGAKTFGCKAVVYLPKAVSPAREQAIRSFGAETARVDGTYDDAVALSVATARRHGHILIQDTVSDGTAAEITACRRIMHGYTIIAEEIVAALGGDHPTHVILQTGVGGFAASLIAAFEQFAGDRRPAAVLLESAHADAAVQSFAAGALRDVTLAAHTMMAGIDCGRLSDLAWPMLDAGADFAAAIGDAFVPAAMRIAAAGIDGDPAFTAGETGCGGLALLLALSQNPGARAGLGLEAASRVLVISTEGATDPAIYADVIAQRGKFARSSV